MSSKVTIFVSDLHLSADRPQATAQFEYFINHIAAKAQTLYILGDLFHQYLGDNDPDPYNHKIKMLIKTLVEKHQVPCYIMRGNHDFLYRKTFTKQTGCKVLTDPTVINLYQQPVLITHGDYLCTDDKGHQHLRQLVHNPVTQCIWLCLPISWRRAIWQKISGGIDRTVKSANITDVSAKTVVEEMQNHQVQLLIHGHTHRPDIHSFKLNDQNAKRIVLPDWGDKVGYLSYTEQGEAVFKYISL